MYDIAQRLAASGAGEMSAEQHLERILTEVRMSIVVVVGDVNLDGSLCRSAHLCLSTSPSLACAVVSLLCGRMSCVRARSSLHCYMLHASLTSLLRMSSPPSRRCVSFPCHVCLNVSSCTCVYPCERLHVLMHALTHARANDPAHARSGMRGRRLRKSAND